MADAPAPAPAPAAAPAPALPWAAAVAMADAAVASTPAPPSNASPAAAAAEITQLVTTNMKAFARMTREEQDAWMDKCSEAYRFLLPEPERELLRRAWRSSLTAEELMELEAQGR
jgi:hypothetical protein